MEKRKGEFQNIIEREKGLQRRLSTRQLSMIAIGGACGLLFVLLYLVT
ncbi:hypothetical protein [Bacillus sp. TL12]|nr:hypothetical protein [Bacillus sp. TL12]MCI0765149.1 hypothetical protein [Bacillus sp. TL12]